MKATLLKGLLIGAVAGLVLTGCSSAPAAPQEHNATAEAEQLATPEAAVPEEPALDPEPAEPVWEDLNGTFCDESGDCLQIELPSVVMHDNVWEAGFREMNGPCFTGVVSRTEDGRPVGSARLLYCPAGAEYPEESYAPNEDSSRDRMMVTQTAGTTWKFRQ